MYFYFLKNKYPNLYIPNPKVKTMLTNLDYDNIDTPTPFMNYYHELAWTIIYQGDDMNYFHPNTILLLKAAEKNNKFDFSCFLVSIKNQYGGLHATPLFIDFNKKQVIRWDSFGYNNERNKVDDYIKTNIAEKMDYEYLSLNATQNLIGIQEKTKENEKQNMKRGDFGGFCVAWTIWFIEHKIINNNLHTKKLINKLEDIIFNKNKPVNYIRNYSNYLFETVKELFKKNNWDLDDYTNNVITYELEKKIFDFLIKEL